MANKARFKIGLSVFFVQAINISGGINPKIVSEKKKVISIPALEKVSVTVSKPLFISYTYLLKTNNAITANMIGKNAFFTLSQTNI